MAEHRITLAGKGVYHRDWIDRYQHPDIMIHSSAVPPAIELKHELKTAITAFRSTVYECLTPIIRNNLLDDYGAAKYSVKHVPGKLQLVAGSVRFYTKEKVRVVDVLFKIELGQKDLEFIFQRSAEETARSILENIVSGRTPAA